MLTNNLYSVQSTSLQSIEETLREIVLAVRQCLEMDLAFISEFSKGRRVFRYVEAKANNAAIKVGEGSPCNQSYCQKIVDGDLPPVIQDTAKNTITKDMPVTLELNIGAYIGVPITFEDGKVYGTLCCFKEQADESLNQRDHNTVQVFAELAAKLIQRQARLHQSYCHKKAEISQLIDNKRLNMHYQPIYSLTKKHVVGFEALSRFAIEPYRSPDQWFEQASAVDLGGELEMFAMNQALDHLQHFPPRLYIAINISPEHILSGAVYTILANNPPSNLVLEITEHAPITDYQRFTQELCKLKPLGVKLAIDDVGSGYASLNHILELQPDIIKLDLKLIQGVEHDQARYSLAKSLSVFANEINCLTVAEGVETQEQFDILKDLKIDNVQGYLIGKPLPLDTALQHR